jgi:hypothetical protein
LFQVLKYFFPVVHHGCITTMNDRQIVKRNFLNKRYYADMTKIFEKARAVEADKRIGYLLAAF